jgi:hypothetical protein
LLLFAPLGGHPRLASLAKLVLATLNLSLNRVVVAGGVQNLGLSDKMKTLGVSSTFGQPPQARAAGEMAVAEVPNASFARANTVTSTPAQVKWALEIRAVQKVTRLGVCLPVALRREASDSNLPDERRSGSGSPGGASGEGKIVRKANVEKIFRRLLDNVTTPETFSQVRETFGC